ncbi:MAG: hypothetical protein LBN03_01355 [Bifidobacteriaceae bacterium]|jgi:hypothetical protein|nr:hypothetical protein [Bifidobacteriaceae bacterium]
MLQIKNFFSKHLNLLILSFVTVIVCFPILITDRVAITDGKFTIARVESVINALKDGQIVPLFDPTLSDGFGYSFNIFYGPLLGYLCSIVKFILGCGTIFSINFTTTIIIFITSILLYNFVGKLTDFRIGLLAGIMYITSNIVSLYIFMICSQSALLAICGAILVLDGLTSLFNKGAYTGKIIIGASICILSHNLSFIILIITSILFCILNFRNISWKIIKKLLICCSAIIGITAFYTFPLIQAIHSNIYLLSDPYFKKYLLTISSEDIKNSATSFTALFIGIGSEKNILFNNFTSVALFLGNAILLIYHFKFKIINPLFYKFAAVGFGFSLLMIDYPFNIAYPGWLQNFQSLGRFSWMIVLVLIISFCLGIFNAGNYRDTNSRAGIYSSGNSRANKSHAGISLDGILQAIFSKVKNAYFVWAFLVIYIFSGIIIGSTMYFYESKNESYSPNISEAAEYYPKNILNNCIEIKDIINEKVHIGNSELGHDLVISCLKKHSSIDDTHVLDKSDYYTKIDTDISLVELPQIYYPGFKATADDEKLKVSESEFGLVQIEIPENFRGEIHSYFSISNAGIIGLIFSLCTILILIIIKIRGRNILQ